MESISKKGQAFWHNTLNVNGNTWVYALLTTDHKMPTPELYFKKQKQLEERLTAEIQKDPELCKEKIFSIQEDANLHFYSLMQPDNLQMFFWFQI